MLDPPRHLDVLLSLSVQPGQNPYSLAVPLASMGFSTGVYLQSLLVLSGGVN